MRVGWLADRPGYVGGAELTEREFRAAAPPDIQIVECLPGAVDDSCDRYAIHNCVTFSLDDLQRIKAPAIKYWNDVGSWLTEDQRTWLDRNALPVCCSPLQLDYMGYAAARLIPPPVPLHQFEHAAEQVNGSRAGAVSVGSWRNRGKGAHCVQAWGGRSIDFYGAGPFAPAGSQEIDYLEMPDVLAGYRTFVFLPEVIEPFGRCVVEAWAAGCELIINGLVGAAYWIEHQPDKFETAAGDFWEAVVA